MRFIDLTGKRFGKLRALNPQKKRQNQAIYWNCKCKCGRVKSIHGGNLRRGLTKSCGLCSLADLTGQRFGEWSVTALAEIRDGTRCWMCQCSCGTTKIQTTTALVNKRTTRCRRCVQTFKVENGAGMSSVLRTYKKSAKHRGIAYGITDEWALAKMRCVCHYCWAGPSNHRYKEGVNGKVLYSFRYNGLDRKHNDQGYTRNNVVTCCYRCNRGKSDQFTYKEWWKMTSYFRASTGHYLKVSDDEAAKAIEQAML